MTPIGDVWYDINLSVKVTVQDQSQKRYIKETITTCRDQVTGTTQIRNSLDQNTPIGEFRSLKRDVNKHITAYGGSTTTLKGDKGTNPTSNGGSGHHTHMKIHKRADGVGDNISIRNNALNSTVQEEKLSMHTSRSKKQMSLILHGSGNRCFLTSK